jgi:hypothetical protein
LADKNSAKTLLSNIYSIRSLLTHSGLIVENADSIKKYWGSLDGIDFDEKYNSAINGLESVFKKIIKIYLEKKISFQIVDIKEDI